MFAGVLLCYRVTGENSCKNAKNIGQISDAYRIFNYLCEFFWNSFNFLKVHTIKNESIIIMLMNIIFTSFTIALIVLKTQNGGFYKSDKYCWITISAAEFGGESVSSIWRQNLNLGI